jgi:hypothetical protein
MVILAVQLTGDKKMINVLYLLKQLETNKLSVLVENIDAPLLDINVALFESEDSGQVKIDHKKDKIEALQEATPSYDVDLADKMLSVIKHYASKEINISAGKLQSWVKNPGLDHNYPYHDYVCTLQYLIDTNQIIEETVTVPQMNKRPFHRFVFLCLKDNPNEEWNSREVNKWIARWDKNK